MTTNSPAAVPDIRDIKPPIDTAVAPFWLGWAIGIVLVLLFVGLLLWWWLKNRKPNVVLPPPLPAHMRAKRKLREALALISQPKPFVIAVSDTARTYLEERFTFRAPERTTEEFLRELAGTQLLMPDQKESLGHFLEQCDLVKFAKYEPGEKELLELHQAAVRLVEETEPQAAPGADNPPAAEPVETPRS